MDLVDFVQVVKTKKEISETNQLLREQISLLREIKGLLELKKI
jgi:hypothetical protein